MKEYFTIIFYTLYNDYNYYFKGKSDTLTDEFSIVYIFIKFAEAHQHSREIICATTQPTEVSM